MNEKEQTVSENQLREEFDRWAEAGKGESMEIDHLPIVEPVLALMRIAPDENVLDIGCGGGWLSRLIAPQVPDGRMVGMDISGEMVRHARRNCAKLDNSVFIAGGVDEIPWESNFFTKIISVESSYYWPDPARGLREIFRVLREGGSAWIVINYYRDNPYCHHWGQMLPITMHLLSAGEWKQLFLDAGFGDVEHRLIPDPSPSPETYSGRWFRDAAEMKAFKKIGALLIYGTKPLY
jgi:ubiquinone/menaquinone biosynthesis C-methylase UbiE